MSVKTTSSRFILSSFDWYAGFYQQLIGGISSFEELGSRVVKIAEQAQAFRQYDRVREAAQILANLPIKRYQIIGHYYLGLCELRNGKSPVQIFERVAEYAPARYRALAMYSLAAIEARKQDYEAELSWMLESMKIYPTASVIRGIAVVKSKEGHRNAALKDLENLVPLLQYTDPFVCNDCLNSLAVEYGEAGRKYEAQNIIKYVLASPYAIAYPEWRETAEELKGPNRSFVFIGQSQLRPRNVLSMPAFGRDQGEPPEWAGQPAPVVDYQQWKTRMAKKKKRNGNKPVDQMTEGEMMMEIMNLYTDAKTTNADRRKIYIAVMKAMFEPDKPDTPDEPNDDNPGA